jgi:putative membrane protein
MKKMDSIKVSKFVSRSVVVSTIAITALVVRAQQPASDTRKDAGASVTATRQAANQNDPATCIKQAAEMNMATIQFAQLAGQKAENAQLKRFAQTLEQDHKRAQSKLETIAKKQGVTLPTSLDAKCEEELTKLRGFSGQEFDKEFAKGAVEGHAMAAAHLQQASTQVKDSDLSQYTKDMLREVRDHQRQAREIASAVGVDQATITSLENKAVDAVGSPAKQAETSTESSSTKRPVQPKN